MRGCVFCDFAHARTISDVFYQDDKVFAMLSYDRAVEGHTLVVWKKHLENASDLSLDDFSHFSMIFHKVEKSLLKTLNKSRSIVLKSGGLVNHFHFHIYPVDRGTSWEE